MRRDDRTTNTKPHSFPPIATESYTTQRERRNAILIQNPKRRKPELQAEDAQMVERKAETRRETWTPHMDVPRDGATQLRSSPSLSYPLSLSLLSLLPPRGGGGGDCAFFPSFLSRARGSPFFSSSSLLSFSLSLSLSCSVSLPPFIAPCHGL